MTPQRIDIIAGARPNFMKIAPIIRSLERHRAAGGCLDYRLVHTGQHYDERMSGDFFRQLGIPMPHVNLGAGSGTQAEQTASIMVGYERALTESPSHACLVVGDVTSTMACAIVARKIGIPVYHVEAGIRSGDWAMPEEINRVVTDSITNEFFTTSRWAGENLRQHGAKAEHIHFVGNTMIDTLLANLERLSPPEFWDAQGLSSGGYLVLTLHRPSNVDSTERLSVLLETIDRHAGGLRVVFPVHPRTAKRLSEIGRTIPSLLCVEPQPYLQFNYLVRHAMGVLTDSGGITEETTVLGVPCMTLRDSTERPETVRVGTNELLGTDPSAIGPALERLRKGAWKKGEIPELWDGNAAPRIVETLARLHGAP